MRRRDEQDPLVGALPGATANTTGSPALAGQPPSITGARGAMPEMPRTSSAGGGMPPPGPALAPAPAPQGTADVGGAPLSIDGATEQAAGAGGQFDNFDLVKDRGTPDVYWQETLNKIGSQNALSMMGDAANAASHRTGEQAMMDPEVVRRDGVRVNEAMGMGNDPELQDNNIEGLVYSPMSQLLRQERDTGTIDSDEADFRMMTTMAQVEGPETEDELREIFVSATRRMSDEQVEPAEPVMEQAEAEEPMEEVEAFETEEPAVVPEQVGEGVTDDTATEIPEEKEGLWSRFKTWWRKGTEDETIYVDPETGEQVAAGTPGAEERTIAAEDVEVTKFMGGMTRQELGMFVFQWGALMMANAEEGFGGALGAASLGAMQGHQARQAQAFEQEGALLDREATRRGLAETGGFETDEDGFAMEQVYNSETGEMEWRRAMRRNAETGEMEPWKPLNPRQYQGEKAFILDFGRSIGKTDDEIWNAWTNAVTEDDRRSFFERELSDIIQRAIADPSLMPNQGVDPVLNKKYEEFTEDDRAEWVERQLRSATRARDATEAFRRAQRGAAGE